MFKKDILIAGGSKGLGFEIVKEFSSNNNLFVLSRKISLDTNNQEIKWINK